MFPCSPKIENLFFMFSVPQSGVVLCVLSCLAIILLRKRELVALFHGVLDDMSLSVLCVSSSGCSGSVCDCVISWTYSLAFRLIVIASLINFQVDHLNMSHDM